MITQPIIRELLQYTRICIHQPSWKYNVEQFSNEALWIQAGILGQIQLTNGRARYHAQPIMCFSCTKVWYRDLPLTNELTWVRYQTLGTVRKRYLKTNTKIQCRGMTKSLQSRLHKKRKQCSDSTLFRKSSVQMVNFYLYLSFIIILLTSCKCP